MLPSLIGSTSIRIKSSLELAGTASVWHWVSFWCLLTGATHATSTLLITWHSKKKKSYNEVKITSQQHWQRWTSYTHFTPCPFTTITKKKKPRIPCNSSAFWHCSVRGFPLASPIYCLYLKFFKSPTMGTKKDCGRLTLAGHQVPVKPLYDSPP